MSKRIHGAVAALITVLALLIGSAVCYFWSRETLDLASMEGKHRYACQLARDIGSSLESEEFRNSPITHPTNRDILSVASLLDGGIPVPREDAEPYAELGNALYMQTLRVDIDGMEDTLESIRLWCDVESY